MLPPYHLTANACAEKLVRTFKNTFRKMEGSGSLNEKLNTFSFTYRITPTLILALIINEYSERFCVAQVPYLIGC